MKSKTSSGYDDEEDNDDDNRDFQQQPYVQLVSRTDERGDKNDQYVITTSGDEDYIDISEIDSTSSFNNNCPKSSCRRKFVRSRFEVLWPLSLYPPSEEIKIAKELSFTKRSLYENHTEVIKTFMSDSKIHEDNIHLVYKMLVEMEDITCMSEYPPTLLQNCPNIDEIVTPFIDEVVLVLSQAVPELNLLNMQQIFYCPMNMNTSEFILVA
ncbi:hypothetical protein DOY81_010325 [Sarcophaga bullata]|nr:hypothetical protein DOY81_010325 [Sarcophaga bullata]